MAALWSVIPAVLVKT